MEKKNRLARDKKMMRNVVKTYKLILICSNGSENSFRKDITTECLLFQIINHKLRAVMTQLVRSQLDQMNSRLVFMHRIEDNLFLGHKIISENVIKIVSDHLHVHSCPYHCL